MLKLIIIGMNRYIKKTKNLTLVLILSYFLLVFFYSIFNQMSANVHEFWVDKFVGGNIIVESSVDYYDFYKPVNLSNSFDYNHFVEQAGDRSISFAPRLRTGALLEKDQEEPMIIIGVDPEKELALGSHIVVEKGEWISRGKDEILLSQSMANSLGVKIGEKVIMTTMTIDGYPSYEFLTLKGYLSFGNLGMLYGDNIAYLPLDSLQKYTMVDSGYVNEVIVGSKESRKLKLNKEYKLISGISTIGLSKMIYMAINILGLLLFILFATFLIHIISHNIIIIIESRKKEISVLLTFGAQPYWIRCIMFTELLFFSIYCSLIGSIISWLGLQGFNSLGIYSFDIGSEILLSTSHFLVSIQPDFFFGGFLVIFVFLCIGSLLSIFKYTGAYSIKSLLKDN